MFRLRLLTANLWNGRAEPNAIAEAIAEHDPDVVLAQELGPAQADVIARARPHGLLLPDRDKCGMGVALRWGASVTRIALPHRDALRVLLEPGAAGPRQAIEIVNVHLSAPTRVRRLGLRREQLRALDAHFRNTSVPARVLAGDLNSLSWMPAYRALKQRLGVDAARARTFAPRPTWSPRASWPRFLRIDHVLLHGLCSLECRVVRIAGTDHSALLATIGEAPGR